MRGKEPSRLEETLKTANRNWALLVTAGAWLFGIVASFLTPLPYQYDYSTITGGDNGAAGVTALGRIVVALLVGLFLLPAMKWSSARHAWKWGTVSALFLVFLIGGFFVYDGVTNECVFTYSGKRLLIGTRRTPEITSSAEYSKLKTQGLLDWFHVNQMDRIWTTESMFACRRRLLALYFVRLLVSIVTILSTLQAIRCIGSPN